MEAVVFIIIVVAALGFFASLSGKSGLGGARIGGSHHGKQEVQAALSEYGVRVDTAIIQPTTEVSTHRVEHTYHFMGVDRAGVKVSGEVTFRSMGKPIVHFDSSAGARAAQRLGLDGDSEEVEPPSIEDQIRREVARRLDQLQSTPGAFMQNDANNDGMVDSEEWNAARQRVEAEVRAEFEARGDGASASTQTTTSAQAENNAADHW